MARIALIGGTGLVGGLLLPFLDDHSLLSIARRSHLDPREEWREKIADLDRWPALLAGERVDVGIAAIGTTWAKVKDWERFEAIDRHGVANFAAAAKAAGARQFIVISSAMADAASRNRYLAIKGAMEDDLRALRFDRLDIVRPGLLRGKRGGERRLKERLGILISPFVNPLLPSRFRAIDAPVVARAIATLVDAPQQGVHVHHNADLKCLAVEEGPQS